MKACCSCSYATRDQCGCIAVMIDSSWHHRLSEWWRCKQEAQVKSMGKVLCIKSCSVCNPCTGCTCWSIHHWALSMEQDQVGWEWDVSPDVVAWGICVASIGSVWRCVDVDYGVVLVGWNAMFYDKVIRKHLRRSWYHVFLELSLRWKYTSWCQQKTYVRFDILS